MKFTLPDDFNHKVETDEPYVDLIFRATAGYDFGSAPRLTLVPVAAVPSSGTLALLGVGFAGFTATRIRRRGRNC